MRQLPHSSLVLMSNSHVCWLDGEMVVGGAHCVTWTSWLSFLLFVCLALLLPWQLHTTSWCRLPVRIPLFLLPWSMGSPALCCSDRMLPHVCRLHGSQVQQGVGQGVELYSMVDPRCSRGCGGVSAGGKLCYGMDSTVQGVNSLGPIVIYINCGVSI